MKIIFSTTLTIILLAQIFHLTQSINLDYRYKPRGPPRPPRQPPIPPYLKKWEYNRQRNPIRPPRPIPLEHSIPNFVQPQAPPALLAPVIVKQQVPIRAVWQNPPQTQFKVKPEKPFQFSAPITTTHEYDYQIQTNSIPNHIVPIKQVGEKGPIHTIPAPNLSPADRPADFEEFKRPTFNYVQQHAQTVVPNSHQYQVTESSELAKTAQKNIRDQQLFYQNQQAYPAQTFNNADDVQSFGTVSSGNEPVLSQHEIYQLINSHLSRNPPEQPQLYNNYDTSVLSHQSVNLQPTELSLSDYKAMIGQSQPIKTNAQYLQELQQTLVTPNLYNYERHAPSADQILDNYSNGELQMQQEPFIQEILDLNQDSPDLGNRVEPKGEIQSKLSEGTVYYANLPSRQAAEALSSLQNAGHANVQQFEEQSSNASPLNIYVPDSQHFTNFEISSSIRHNDGRTSNSDIETEFANGKNVNDVQDDVDEAQYQQDQREFGKRTKPNH